VVPGSLCRAWLDHRLIRLQTGCAVARVQAVAAGWQALDAAGSVLAEADAVVLANAREVLNLSRTRAGRCIPCAGRSANCRPAVCRNCGEWSRARAMWRRRTAAGRRHLRTRRRSHCARAASDRSNLARLEAILPGAGERFAAEAVHGRASLRATLPDRLPLVGAVGGQSGLFVAAGYASRGVVWAGLLGEALADLMTGQPLPLEADLMRAIAPDRFARR